MRQGQNQQAPGTLQLGCSEMDTRAVTRQETLFAFKEQLRFNMGNHITKPTQLE